jgi:membrane-associated protease RseP (regulator of RpoE activity)
MSIPEIELLNNQVSKVFRIEDVTAGDPREWIARYRGYFLTEDTVAAYDQLAEALKPYNLVVLFRKGDDAKPVIFIASAPPIPKLSSRITINIVLFILTILSVMLTGADVPADAMPADGSGSILLFFRYILSGWPFALSMVGILFAHEMGHYLACRYYKIPATLPFFIPAPIVSPFGTLGAFIAMRGAPKNKRILFDVGIAGPLAGLVIAIPVLFYGLSISQLGAIEPSPAGFQGTLEGNSLFYLFSKYLVFGKLLPEPVSMNGLSPLLYWLRYFFSGHPIPFGGLDVQLHSVAWAGWGGLLVTTLNLMPLGTLDGGHVAYGLFGEKARKLFPFMIGLLITFSVLPVVLTLSITAFNFNWLLWGMILFWLGNVRTQPLDDITPLDPTRRALGIFILIIFVLLFTPIPLVAY